MANSKNQLFCEDLPTNPDPSVHRVLVTGAAGYVGGRLIPELLARDYKVRCMVRGSTKGYKNRWQGTEIVSADALNVKSLKKALKDVHTAYYLIHSLLLGPKEFEKTDIKAAMTFSKVAEECGVKRIIYLGGLGDYKKSKSRHLKSRMKVAEELKKGKTPVTILLAAVIIGSGSASYEIIHHLVKKMRFMPVPHWVNNRCQPIGIRDVLKYLVGVLETKETSDKMYDIGGADVLTYREMLADYAKVVNKKIFIFRSPISSIKIYSYLSSLLTPVPAQLTSCLMEGLKDEVVCRENNIRKILNFEPLAYKVAVARALSKEQQDQIYTRWSDAFPPAHVFAMKLTELQDNPSFISSYSLLTKKTRAELFSCLCKIGGKTGWFYSSWLWRLRGMIDRLLLGVGTSRGRRNQKTLHVNDVVDFWRVEDIKQNRRLLLRAEMKLPGKAWLEFSILNIGEKSKLTITAYFDVKTIFGRLYWFMFVPFHHFIFTHLIEDIEKRA